MTDFSRATGSNIKRFQNLLDTSIALKPPGIAANRLVMCCASSKVIS